MSTIDNLRNSAFEDEMTKIAKGMNPGFKKWLEEHKKNTEKKSDEKKPVPNFIKKD